jgi:uncharacterized protein (DUF924 family)
VEPVISAFLPCKSNKGEGIRYPWVMDPKQNSTTLGRAQEVLHFWFGDDSSVSRPEWFRKDPVFDERIRTRFGDLHTRAALGELADWANAPESALALILVLDQFSRNMFRDDARAFAQDAAALKVAARMIEEGMAQHFTPAQQRFVFMPFMHSEALADQDKCVALFEALGRATGEADSAEWAIKHRNVIAQFGRFPHRNAILGRVSTPDEIAFLGKPGSRF